MVAHTPEFIAYDESSGGTPRYTHLPDWKSCVKSEGMSDEDWKSARIEFLGQHASLLVFYCTGNYSPTEDTYRERANALIQTLQEGGKPLPFR